MCVFIKNLPLVHILDECEFYVCPDKQTIERKVLNIFLYIKPSH